MTRNVEVAELLEEFADLLAAQDVEYKPRSYQRAAEHVRDHPVAVEELVRQGEDAVQQIEGVGEAIAGKIVEYIETDEIEELEGLREELPVRMDELTAVEGVGPKTVGALYEALGITTLDELEAAAEAGEIRTVSGFGAKTEANILEHIPFAREASARHLLGHARPVADELLEYLREDDRVDRASVAGSIRRWRPTIGDIDVLVATDAPEAVVSTFTDWDRVDTVLEAGSTKASARARGVRVDIRLVPEDTFGGALQYFTGSRDHNVRLRQRAIDRDLKMSEYGVFDVSRVGQEEREDDPRAGERVAGETEESMYEALDLPWIPPELREDAGEVDAAAADDLPDLIERSDVRGELHNHTEWSDGAATIEEMALAAAEVGYEYLGICDHATGPGIVGGTGLSDEELLEQAETIRALDEEVDVKLYAGVEANIDENGEVGVAEDVLAELDVVVASAHNALDQDAEVATDRLVRAIEHPGIDILGHPTGRMLHRREGLSPSIERLASAAAAAGTALEINANPARLDLGGSMVRAAIDGGATVAINTDAHSPGEFANVRYGVHTARRGWCEPDDVLTTWERDELEAFLEG